MAEQLCPGGWHECRLNGGNRQPWNTWSNAAYAVAGAALLAQGSGAGGLLLVALGTASFLYHGNVVWWGGRADVGALYATLLAVGMLALAPAAWWVLPFSAAFGYGAQRLRRRDLTAPVGAGFAWALGLVTVARGFPLTGALLFAGGYVLWLADLRGLTGRVGHAGWHALTAAGFYELLAPPAC